MTVCVDTFNALLPERFSRGENLDRSLRTKAKTLYDDMRKVRKNCKGSRKRDEQRANVLDKPYEHPGMLAAPQSSAMTPRKRKLKSKIEDQKRELRDLKKTLGKERQEKASIEADVYQQALLEMESLFIQVQNLTSTLKTVVYFAKGEPRNVEYCKVFFCGNAIYGCSGLGNCQMLKNLSIAFCVIDLISMLKKLGEITQSRIYFV